MVFFGSKGKVVAGEVLEGVTCPECGQSRFATFGILNYFHIYWIPTILTSKKAGMECLHCKRTLVDDEIPPHLIEQIKSGVFSVGRTLPMFSGLIIIALLALGITYSIQQDNAEEATYMAAPAVNDYYIFDFSKLFVDSDDEYKYGILRITDVESDAVEMQVSKLAYNKPSGARKDIREGNAAAADYYDAEILYFELPELPALKADGTIYAVERD